MDELKIEEFLADEGLKPKAGDIIFSGNPGVGKSTLSSALFGALLGLAIVPAGLALALHLRRRG